LGWWRGRIAEALRALITLKGHSAVSEVSAESAVQRACAEIDALVYELRGKSASLPFAHF